MPTPIDRAEINRENSKRSTGPRSSAGKLSSKFNALKHGMSAKLPVLPGEDEAAFRRRVEEWTDHLAPRNPVEQFLVEQAVTASWKLERSDRVETARLSSMMRTAPAEPPGRIRTRSSRWAGGSSRGRAIARERVPTMPCPGIPRPSSIAWNRPRRAAFGCSLNGTSCSTSWRRKRPGTGRIWPVRSGWWAVDGSRSPSDPPASRTRAGSGLRGGPVGDLCP